ncbi:MAG: leucine-rich repeat domain-containing protein [Eubacteriales bacterium]
MSLSLSLIACGGEKTPNTTSGTSDSGDTVTDDTGITTSDEGTDSPIESNSGEYDLYGLGQFVSNTADDTFTYKIYENGVALTGYKGSGGEITLPASVDGKSVTVVGEYAIGEGSGVTKVTIPSGYTAIARSAFYRCTTLTAVEIPSSVTSIGNKAFAYNESLTSATVPDSVSDLGSSVFFGCSALTECKLPSDLTRIPDQTFYGCTSLIYSVPDNVTEIGNEAFYYCTSLTKLEIPASVHVIGDSAFYFCTGVTEIEFAHPVATFANEIDDTESEEPETSEPENPGIPANGLVSIGSYAFYNLYAVTELNIPETVISIGDYAFCGMVGIDSVTIPESIGTTETYAGIGEIVGVLGSGAFANCTGLTGIDIPDSITKIPAFIVYGCENITSIRFNPEITSIQNGAFGKTAITEFTMPENVTNLGYSVFYQCKNLAKVDIGSRVSNLMQNLFNGCVSLTEITLPSQVTAVGASSFEGCTSLATLNVQCASNTTFNTKCFYNCPSLKEVHLPASITTLNANCLGYVDGEPAYEGATPDPVPLEDFVLYGYLGGRQETYAKTFSSSLAEYTDSDTLPEDFFHILGVTGYSLYENFEFDLIAPPEDSAALRLALATDTTDGETEEEVVASPVGLIITKYKGNEENVKLPTYFRLNEDGEISLYGVNRRIVFIGEDAFRGNESIVSVTVTSTLEEIRANAFRDCVNLETIDLSGTILSTVGENAFLNTNVYKFALPSTLTSVGAYAFCYEQKEDGTYSILPTYEIKTTEKVTKSVNVTEIVTDENGDPTYKDDGTTPVTQVVTAIVTDKDGMPQHNADGSDITEVVTSTYEEELVNVTEVKVGITGFRASAAYTYASEYGLTDFFTAATVPAEG